MSGTLLLADDSITIQKVVELTFAETEHRVVAVGSGRELLRRMSEVNPDVVLCDVVMPDMNGYDVCQSLKSDPATLHIPVVLLTGTFEPFDRDRALAVGSDSIVTKPFEARELIATVEDLIRRSQAMRTAAPMEHGTMGDFGIPEGVPSLDFTTTGFDKMVPAPPAPELPPEHGMELSSSGLGSSYAAPAPPPPVELQPADEAPPVAALSLAPEAAPASEPWGEPPAAPSGGMEEETFPSARATEVVEVEPPAFSATAPAAPFGDFAKEAPSLADEDVPTARIPIVPEEEQPARFEGHDAGEGFLPDVGPGGEEASAVASEPPFREAVAEADQPPMPRAELPVSAMAVIEAAAAAAQGRVEPAVPATIVQPYEMTEADIGRVAERVLALLPAPEPTPAAAPATPAAPTAELSAEQIDAIARRVLELARPLIEQIAWEVIPDMGEMLIRARIRELEAVAEQEN
jgi:CheY-like chemotaxis protein